MSIRNYLFVSLIPVKYCGIGIKAHWTVRQAMVAPYDKEFDVAMVSYGNDSKKFAAKTAKWTIFGNFIHIKKPLRQESLLRTPRNPLRYLS